MYIVMNYWDKVVTLFKLSAENSVP
jgi:hypothetical protein